MKLLKLLRTTMVILLVGLGLNSCIGTVVGAAVDTTIEVAKVPFKVAGAAVDVLVPDDDDDEADGEHD
ncbi:MAG: NF038104 family lipoprotein [Proteobacteria bacterium]|nr:NF038104 family lipoprotein [Pseudomonadota bacterium]MDA0926717.1 NF038104 family lipoprotein [Pseudomonadota bacterium]